MTPFPPPDQGGGAEIMSMELEQAIGSAPAKEEEPRTGSTATEQTGLKAGCGRETVQEEARREERPRPGRSRRPSHGDNDDPRTLYQVYDKLVMGIIRPPRMSYEYPRGLGPAKCVVSGGIVTVRTDFQVQNPRGHRLECSVWKPENIEVVGWPCVVYLHGNSSSRVEAVKTNVLKAVITAGAALVGFDFSGCGNSDGSFVSLGWYEQQDAAAVISKVKSMGAGSVVLWGRSMGAVTALLYGAQPTDEAPSGIIVDSPFSSFKQLAFDLTSRGMIRVPNFLSATILSMIRRSVKQRAGFDLSKLKPVTRVVNCMCPALFFAAEGDELIPPWHGEMIENKYGGPSLGVRFDGTHNSARPPCMYALASVFIHGVTRRAGQAPETVLNLIEKTAVVTSQEDEENGRLPRHPYRYDGREPKFVKAGTHSIQHIATAAKSLIQALDLTLACRAVENFLINELVEVGVAVVQAELQAAQADAVLGKRDLLEEVKRVQYEHARLEIGMSKTLSRDTTWEMTIDNELNNSSRIQEDKRILDGLRRIHAAKAQSTAAVGSPVARTNGHHGPQHMTPPRCAGSLQFKSSMYPLCCCDASNVMETEPAAARKDDHLSCVADEFFQVSGSSVTRWHAFEMSPAGDT